MINQLTLIIGANSDIGKAIATQVASLADTGLILISRQAIDEKDTVEEQNSLKTKKITVKDYQPQSIDNAIAELVAHSELPISQVFVCNGILHSDKFQPEKRLEDFDAQAFEQVISANTLTPMLWVQKLTPILTRKSPCKFIVFSARVGSINDNKLGGWYSYRASKAALNMMLKTASIEFARRAKNIKLISFHPGTTDTPLSKPFQKNVPADKLFTSEFVAKQLLTIVADTPIDHTLSYLDWQGKSINW
ncbi:MULTISPECIES: SDR family NAD(P)-dependent oxidoreductase [unclassified Colwellia]|jgi:NAD(P)-dependent dehydrogenase (short-subunit alcohol dehydrogenase family)|uniref:SDR family NAD(P)-dependent oxidoreductase n=1 Tax=unclassified Colwellia TaxID=196834 RepID=UPI0015F55DDE|nr:MULTISPECIES: SDR family NAD(P)-dependent oxidoreductase [unclassified Colwellia]MBA6380068.1 SDR family NAD(P)-dependent oxidoreductase [Colwellia sp. BRX10-7]MBA6387264.1 SDR family NAD(P)-dependent oxidoreductase [Colwellia sp. BRX10-2]MBA6402299.1 SDR family NAD(P)-dependent oxidoreductase [Colwellia sp. BRX10-5]MBA6406568.1 SDR family NAD(P)-dependent oxidoreductase [Colwellia sp. BRX10-1]